MTAGFYIENPPHLYINEGDVESVDGKALLASFDKDKITVVKGKTEIPYIEYVASKK